MHLSVEELSMKLSLSGKVRTQVNPSGVQRDKQEGADSHLNVKGSMGGSIAMALNDAISGNTQPCVIPSLRYGMEQVTCSGLTDRAK